MKLKQLQSLVSFLVLSIVANAQNTYPWPSSGNIGIGTTNPQNQLHLSASEPRIQLTPTSFGTSYSSGSWIGMDITGLYFIQRENASTRFLNNGTEILRMISNGNIGIGVTNPIDKLQVQSIDAGIRVKGSDRARINLQTSSQDGWQIEVGETDSSGNQYRGDLGFTEAGVVGGRLVLKKGGNIGIGTTSPSEKLSVNGNIKANGDITAKKITATATSWPDYVFHPFYNLKPLSEVAQFIRQNQHLPDMPSAKEVEQHGVSLGDNQALLLKKIEELTLYIIDMKEEMEQLKKKVNMNQYN